MGVENERNGLSRALFLGESGEDFVKLRDLLAKGKGSLDLEHARIPGEKAEEIRNKKYDMVLCDYEAGNEVSLGTLAEIRRSGGETPVIFLNDALLTESSSHEARVGTESSPHISREVGTAIASYRQGKNLQQHDGMFQQLSRAVEQSADLVTIMDRVGVIEYVNPAFEALTGYAREEVLGKRMGVLESGEESPEVYTKMWETILAGNVFKGIVAQRRRGGETFYVEKIVTPLRDAHGLVTHFVSNDRDITERRRLESQLQQAQKMDAVGRLAGGVAHDFNNLLMVISAYAELTQDSLPAEDPSRRNVKEIMTAARSAADLTRKLLAFGRKQMQSLQLLDLNTAISEICRMLPRLIGEDVELIFEPGVGLGRIKADPVQIEQIIMNLAANARDAMPRGGKILIETAALRMDDTRVQRHAIVPAGDYIVLAVTDTGQGIAPEHMTHIFEPFYTTKVEGKGTGLGLATVYGIVKQNAGFVWVYSEPGLGTTFKIYLPRAEQEHVEAEAATAPEESVRGSETVLLVEDEAMVRQAAREYLSLNGYTVLEAESGEDALRVSREHGGAIHMMVSDVVMPRMGGAKLAEELRGERPGMKVLFVSGYAESTMARHGAIDVTTRFLQKPFSLKALAQKIRSVMKPAEMASSASAD